MKLRISNLLFLIVIFPCVAVAIEDGSQYSPLEEITRGNVNRLELAFTHHNGDLGQSFPNKGFSFQATPVYWAGKLFFSTSSNFVFAIDAADGKTIWQFNPVLARDVSYTESASRGVTLWHGSVKNCPDRIFHGTLNGELYAIDASTGKLCTEFGDNGRIDLSIGIRNFRLGYYGVTSPVAALDDRIIVGSSISDNGAADLEQGIVRALDPVTGNLLWQWDPIPRSPDDPAGQTWHGKGATMTGAANAWAPISVDPQRRLVFVPTSSPSPDYYGGERLGDNHYTNSIVTLNADTGEVVWFRQLVHHDLWDYDVPAEPSLVTIRKDSKEIPAVVVVTKTGMVFAFNRETGDPIYRITETDVPETDVPGEVSSPTQPVSEVLLASPKPIKEKDAFGLAIFDRIGCENIIAQSRSEGIFTPPSLRGTVQSPGWTGGMNWGGIALDESSQIAITNFTNMPGIVKLMSRKEFDEAIAANSMPQWQLFQMAGTPYGVARRIFQSSLGLPCTSPPWGEIAAIDLGSGKTIWRRPLGTVEDLSPVPMPTFMAELLFGDWGVPNLGGPLMTAGNLTFIGATLDYYIRALDSASGEELWRYRLPTSANSTPMSYEHNKKQYVAIAVGGHTGAGTPRGDSLMVFSIP